MDWWPIAHEPPILWHHHQKKRETTIPIEGLHCAFRSPSPWTNSWDLNEMEYLRVLPLFLRLGRIRCWGTCRTDKRGLFSAPAHSTRTGSQNCRMNYLLENPSERESSRKLLRGSDGIPEQRVVFTSRRRDATSHHNRKHLTSHLSNEVICWQRGEKETNSVENYCHLPTSVWTYGHTDRHVYILTNIHTYRCVRGI